MLFYSNEVPVEMISLKRAESELEEIESRVNYYKKGALSIQEDMAHVKHRVTRSILEKQVSDFLFHEKRLTHSFEGWRFVVERLRSGESFEFDLAYKIAETWRVELFCSWSYNTHVLHSLTEDEEYDD